jgi:hypothetical protein
MTAIRISDRTEQSRVRWLAVAGRPAAGRAARRTGRGRERCCEFFAFRLEFAGEAVDPVRGMSRRAPARWPPRCSGRRMARNQQRIDQMNATIFGVVAVTFMMLKYALEPRVAAALRASRSAARCRARRFLAGAWPFGVVEAVWTALALLRYFNLEGSSYGRDLVRAHQVGT